MNLKLVFKIGAVWLGLFGLMMLFAGGSTIESFGVTVTDDLINLARWMGLAMITIAATHWVIPMWAEDSLKNFGMFMNFMLKSLLQMLQISFLSESRLLLQRFSTSTAINLNQTKRDYHGNKFSINYHRYCIDISGNYF